MSQRLLDHLELRAPRDMLGRKGVTQAVGGDVLDAGELAVLLDDVLDPPRAEAALELTQEEMRIVDIGADDQIGAQRPAGGVVEGHGPLLAALSAADVEYPDHPLPPQELGREFNVTDQQVGELAAADPGLEKEFEYRQVPRVMPGRGQQALVLGLGQEPGLIGLHRGGMSCSAGEART